MKYFLVFVLFDIYIYSDAFLVFILFDINIHSDAFTVFARRLLHDSRGLPDVYVGSWEAQVCRTQGIFEP